MRRASSGFTLLEVLIALLVVTVGLLGFVGTLRPLSALAAEGRMRGRIALLLSSRMDQLRSDIAAAAPGCVPPPDGEADHPGRIRESWSSAPTEGGFDVRIETRAPLAGRLLVDTLSTRVACP